MEKRGLEFISQVLWWISPNICSKMHGWHYTVHCFSIWIAFNLQSWTFS